MNKDKKGNKGSDRITEYVSTDAYPENIVSTEIAKQPEFYKIPRRFGSIPVDDLPLGCDKDEQYYKVYPRVSLPFQRAQRISFGHVETEPNRLFWGDNLHIMRMLPSNSIDVIYIDPPFFSGRNYNIIFGDKNETRSFSDIWEGGMPGYLIWINARVLEMKRLLKNTGSIFVHLDWHASHYVKMEMDKIFGYDNFRNEIVWTYTRPGTSKQKQFPRVHETILWYTKGDNWNFYPDEIRIPYSQTTVDRGNYSVATSKVTKGIDKRILPPGKVPEDWWSIPLIQGNATEWLHYPTQKPEKLLERIIKVSSAPGDLVADFFCGGGTTPAVAQRLNRRWIACDQSRVAVAITQGRLEGMYEEEKTLQSRITPVRDISVEYWGTYEIPTLTELSSEEFKSFIVSAFGGRISSAGEYIHGYKREIPLFVGPPSQEKLVTKDEVINFAHEIITKKGRRQGTMLAWGFSPSARLAVEKLLSEGNSDVDLIKISTIDIESCEFKEHVTKLHDDYDSFLTFILPPEVRLSQKRLKPLNYLFDVSESMALNFGAKIINVQWDFDFEGRFTPTKGFSFGRDKDGTPLLKVNYSFDSLGNRTIACRVQDDIGGEKIYSHTLSVH